MRMRHKPYAKPELDACPFYVASAEAQRGQWQSTFQQPQPLILELGCGKGGFAAQYAASHPEINYLAVDYLSDVLVLAKRRVEETFGAAHRAVAAQKTPP
ncbi:MAG: tRNA (guanosine(46)-N7)-methyltransferase TrmB, partial [Pygmaiobacter sp.]